MSPPRRRRNLPPTNAVYRWKGEQESNVKFLYHEKNMSPTRIAELLEIPRECIRYVIYKKKPPKVKPPRKQDTGPKLFLPRQWR